MTFGNKTMEGISKMLHSSAGYNEHAIALWISNFTTVSEKAHVLNSNLQRTRALMEKLQASDAACFCKATGESRGQQKALALFLCSRSFYICHTV